MKKKKMLPELIMSETYTTQPTAGAVQNRFHPRMQAASLPLSMSSTCIMQRSDCLLCPV